MGLDGNVVGKIDDNLPDQMFHSLGGDMITQLPQLALQRGFLSGGGFGYDGGSFRLCCLQLLGLGFDGLNTSGIGPASAVLRGALNRRDLELLPVTGDLQRVQHLLGRLGANAGSTERAPELMLMVGWVFGL